jgi:hypothetical protein
MLQLQLFDTYSNLFSSMEQQFHNRQFPLMLLKNITNKRDVKERIFRTTQETFVTELRAGIVQDLKKLTSSTTFVHIHLQIYPHFAHTNSLHQISAVSFFFFWGGGGEGGGVQLYTILFNILTVMIMFPG